MTQSHKRLGFLIPPGNPTVEPELYTMVPRSASVHFARLHAHGETGVMTGLDERTRSYLASVDSTAALLAMVKPDAVALAYTAGSYALGRAAEKKLSTRVSQLIGCPFITAFGSVIAALASLGARRVALGTPYGEQTTLQAKVALESHGIEVVSHGRLPDVRNIYLETAQRASELAQSVDDSAADVVFLSGVGLPTIAVLEELEQTLGKPVISAVSALMWNSLRVAGAGNGDSRYRRVSAD